VKVLNAYATLSRTRASRLQLVPLAALSVVCVLWAGCGFGRDQVSGGIGDTLVAGDYALTVTKMENPAERPDRFTNPKVGNRFVKFNLTVGNRGQQHLPVAAANFTLRASSPDGRETVDVPARTDISSEGVLRMATLSPGQNLDTSLYFEMPANLNPSQLVFSPSVLGWRTRIEVNLQ
jgi:hypothetical protein